MQSPQLRALGPTVRLLAVFIDGVAAYGAYCPQVEARIESARLVESGRGITLSRSERTMSELGWRSAADIFDRAGIPEKHREVVSWALWGDPEKPRGKYFTIREISKMTNHPPRTVWRWLADDMPKLRRLAEVYETAA